MNPKQQELVEIQVDDVTIEGLLDLPVNAQGIGTLLLDLLSVVAEDQNYQARFDIALLTQRWYRAVTDMQASGEPVPVALAIDQQRVLANDGILAVLLLDYNESSSKSVAMVAIGKNNRLIDWFKGMKPKC